jgi:PAS domain S-box-containing protein
VKPELATPTPEAIAQAMVEGATALGVGFVIVENAVPPRFVFASPGMEAVTGYSTDELSTLDPGSLTGPGELDWRFVEPDHSPAAGREESGALGPSDHRLRRVLRKKDGSTCDVEVAVSDVNLGSRHLSLAFVVDVSHRTKVEEQLRRSEARSRRLLDQAPEAIWVLDRDRVLYANEVCLSLFGYAPGTDYATFNPHEILHPDDVPLFEKRAFAMLALRQPVPPCEYRVRRQGGQAMVIEVSSVAGEFEGRPAIFSFGRDVTSRRQAELRRLQADRLGALGLLAGGMAHAINNPLTYVLLNLDHVALRLPRLAAESTLLSEVLVRLTEARDGAERVANVVRQMRALSRTEDQEQGQVNLREVVKTAAGMVGHEIRHRGTLHVELADVPPVFANAARLEQVFLNLLVYVARSLAEKDGGQVHLRLFCADRTQAVVELTHDGPPIDPRVRQQALELFPGVDEDPQQLASGLSLCNGILRSIGGTMQIETSPEGATTFRVVLPIDTREVALPEPPPRKDSEPPAAMGFRARVMVVDDDAGVIEALRVMLEDEHDVTCVASGRDALRHLLRAEQYDVVFCDLMMPEVSGMDLFEALRLNRPGSERSLVFMTGGAFTQDAVRFLQHVPNPRLDKPFDMRTLSKLLRRVVNAARAQT